MLRIETMDARQFIQKWSDSELKERSSAQEHFIDLCRLIEHPTPAEADPQGETFTFEKGAEMSGGGQGWADVWKKGFFGWEYKGKHANLDHAYRQLLKYRESLENPPLLIVCDIDNIVIRTNFTNTPTEKHEIALDAVGRPRSLEILRWVFTKPEMLKPSMTIPEITDEAARRVAELAIRLRDRGLDPFQVARFLDRVVFCLFAEDMGLLPEALFTELLFKAKLNPDIFVKLTSRLFEAMAQGDYFGLDAIRYFNGNLFSDAEVIPLEPDELNCIYKAAVLDWSVIDPSIFGTLFERGMDPAKRSQLGAHFTGRADIETLVEPVVMQPLRREWDALRGVMNNLLTTGQKCRVRPSEARTHLNQEEIAGEECRVRPSEARTHLNQEEIAGEECSVRPSEARTHLDDGETSGKAPRKPKKMTAGALAKAKGECATMLHDFMVRVAGMKILDPACGSGNFLYVALQKLLDFEKEIIQYAEKNSLNGSLWPQVTPRQLYGIEVSPYAYWLSQVTIWIGYLQWQAANGFAWPDNPVLSKMDNFRCMDAILDLSDPENPKEPQWPVVDCVIGNPPFLGGKFLRRELGDDYVNKLHALYADKLPSEVDLCCYWFEQGRSHIASGRCKRVGLLATQGIRGGANRAVLENIKSDGDIYLAVSDREWILDGANVHVSLIAFDGGFEKSRTLDGNSVAQINANLSSGTDVGTAKRIRWNGKLGFMGTTKQGPFDVTDATARKWLESPNAHGRPNSDVLTPWMNAKDVASRSRNMWIIDFFGMTEAQACLYELPFKHAQDNAKPFREKKPRDWYRGEWWQLYAPRHGMRKALAPLDRFVATPTVSKHRLFLWLSAPVSPDHQLIVVARSDDYFFGLLHSRLHEVWARAQGTQLRERESGFRYTPTTCFETFPLPKPTPEQQEAIAVVAKELDAKRNRWLNPPEWTREEVLEFPGSVSGPWARYVVNPDSNGIGTVRYPRTVPKDADCEARLAERTLTNLYNARPQWLDILHARLDEAVCAAYGWPVGMSDEEILERLLALNLELSA